MTDATPRTCGPCSLCCKVCAVPAMGKPACQWCEHARPGAGCGIYETRPQVCRDFACFWLQGLGPDGLRPDKSKCVLRATNPVEGVLDGLIVQVDPGSPAAWRAPAVQAIIKRFVDDGRAVYIVCGAKRTFIGRSALDLTPPGGRP